ncbi:MAG TPA: hypothetical protein VF601_06270 [Beijerinckiaceae bacterium]|jgi:hypothetical protein
MSEQAKETAAPEPTKAEAAEAVAAKEDPKKAESVAPVEIKVAAEPRAATEPAEAPSRRRSLPPYVAQAAALACALGIGWAAGHAASATKRAPDPAEKALLSVDWTGMASGLQKGQMEAARMAADIQALKGTLGGLKDSVERAKQDAAGRFAQVSERLDRAQKADQEVAARLAALAERADLGPKLAQVAERLDRMEKHAAAAHAAAAQAVAKPVVAATSEPLRTGSIPEAKPVPPQEVPRSEHAKAEPRPEKAMPIEGWVLREVYDGMALIEGRNKRLHEIAPGQSLPGIGKVEAIERRGRAWVVVTNRGIITSQPW